MEGHEGFERNRTFLTYIAAVIAILSLVLYAFTHDPSLLALTGVSGLGLGVVYRFYFRNRE
jgi:hypothetical protein